MSFEERLAPKVDELERRAKEMYGLYLGGYGFTVDSDGRVVPDPDGTGMAPPEVTQEGEQEKYDDYLSYLDAVKDRFVRYYGLDPGELMTIVNSLGGEQHAPAATAIWDAGTVYDRLHYADDQWMRPVLELIVDEDWSGETARQFRDSTIAPFHRAVEFQMACTKILGMAAQAAHDGVVSVQDDLLAIADAGIARLSGERGGSAGGFFTAVSFIAGAVGLFLPTGASQVAGVVSLGSGIASVFAGIDDGDDSREWNVTGVNSLMILESIFDCLLALDEEIDRKDQEMADGLEQDLDSREAFASEDLTLEDPPALDGPDAFGELQVESVPGVPISEDKVVVTLVQLYEAGYRNLPSAAHQFAMATSDLVEPLPYSFDQLFFQTRSTYQQARARLRSAVSGVRWDLTRSGEALIEIAANYDATDEQAAEALRQIGDIAPPPHVPWQSPGDNPVKAAARGAV